MKRILTLLLSLTLLISCLPFSVSANTDAEKLDFVLTVDGENVISAQPGDEIEVSFFMNNVANESFKVSNHQTQIKFDMDFFEYTDEPSSFELLKGSTCTLETKSLGTQVVEILGSHISGARPATFEASSLIAKIRFKVSEDLQTGDSGVISFFYTSAANAFVSPATTYEINANSLTVIIGDEPKEMHTITYKDESSTLSTGSHAAGSSITINHGPSGVTNKKFVGWQDESGKIWYPGDSYTITTDMIFTAVWVNKYTLTFETNGGTAIANKVEWEDTDIIIADYSTTKQGFTFEGWYEDASFTMPIEENFRLTENKTIYAKWAENAIPKYTLTFNTNGGTAIAPITENVGAIIDLSVYVTTKSGFTFEGWYSDVGLTNKISSATLDSNKTVYAKWKENAPSTHTLTFNTNGGSAISAITKEKGSVIDLSSYKPTKSGYEFKGWYQDRALKQKVTSVTLDTDKIVYAKWSLKSQGGGGIIGGGGISTESKYDLVLKTVDGTVLDTVECSKNTTVDLEKYKFDKDGFIFDGWFTDKQLTNKVTQIKMTEDITLYAKWVKDEGSQADKPNYHPEILTTEHYAYIQGRENNLIQPKANITRAEVATIFFRLLTEQVRNENITRENKFTDVNENDWFNTAVSTLANLKIIEGRTENTFEPSANITRAEFTAIAARFSDVKYEGQDLFSDIQGHWANNYINIAASIGWVEGENGIFRPNDNITRAEVVTLVNRVLNRQPESIDDLLDGMVEFSDNTDKNAWYYIAIQEATNSHEYKMKPDGIHEEWTSLTQNPDWSHLEG